MKKPGPASESELTLLAAEPADYALFRFQSIAINVWRSQPNERGVKVLTDLTQESLSVCPKGISSIHCIESGAGVPTSEARRGLRDIATRYESHIACVGVILYGEGFWASAIRSAVAGILLVGPKPAFPLRMYASAQELTAWLPELHQQRTGIAVDASLLLEMIERARSYERQAPARAHV